MPFEYQLEPSDFRDAKTTGSLEGLPEGDHGPRARLDRGGLGLPGRSEMHGREGRRARHERGRGRPRLPRADRQAPESGVEDRANPLLHL